MATTSDILNAALALPPHQRAEVAHKLLLSLDVVESDPEVDQAWANEIRLRLQAIREGRAAMRDWSDALEDIRHSLVPKAGA